MAEFDPRAIPNRAHYDRLMTWAAAVLGKQDGETLADIQDELFTRAQKMIASSDDNYERVFSVLTEIGFCAVIDHMAGIIEEHDGKRPQ